MRGPRFCDLWWIIHLSWYSPRRVIVSQGRHKGNQLHDSEFLDLLKSSLYDVKLNTSSCCFFLKFATCARSLIMQLFLIKNCKKIILISTMFNHAYPYWIQNNGQVQTASCHAKWISEFVYINGRRAQQPNGHKAVFGVMNTNLGSSCVPAEVNLTCSRPL